MRPPGRAGARISRSSRAAPAALSRATSARASVCPLDRFTAVSLPLPARWPSPRRHRVVRSAGVARRLLAPRTQDGERRVEAEDRVAAPIPELLLHLVNREHGVLVVEPNGPATVDPLPPPAVPPPNAFAQEGADEVDQGIERPLVEVLPVALDIPVDPGHRLVVAGQVDG